jgi:hypothetical protein
MIFQLDVVHNRPYKLPQKSMDEKLSPSITRRSPLSSKSHKMALGTKWNAYGTWFFHVDANINIDTNANACIHDMNVCVHTICITKYE